MDPQQAPKAKTAESATAQNNRLADSQPKAENIPVNTMRRMALRVVIIYVIVGALWIVVSDPVLNALVHDPDLRLELSVAKGWIYVAVTALLLFVLLRRETRHWIAERTAREKAEMTMRDSEAPFRQLFESAPLPMAHYALDGVAVRFNRRFVDELGYTADDVPTLGHWQVRAHPDENERVEAVTRWTAAAQRALENGTSIGPEEFRFTCKNGEVRTFLLSGSFLVDGVLAVLIDISDRKKTEAALQDQTELFRQMAENIDEVFWMTGTEHKLLYVSPAYERIWGRSCESLYANPNSWTDAIHPEDRQRVLASAAVRPHGEAFTETYRVLHQDGEQRWVHVRGFPVRDSSGKLYRLVGVATDITDHRKLEGQFRQAQKMEAIGTLAGGIAHDFNNILSAIIGYTELAKLDTDAPPVLAGLDEILRACQRAGDLVRQILTFSRQQEPRRRPIQLWPVIDEATKLLRAALPSTIQFKIEHSDDVPTVLADPTQIHQVVMNLCTNAAHAMKDHPGRLGVKLERFEADAEFVKLHQGTRPGGYARLMISDSGHGMDQATLDRIYEPFFTTKSPGEGTGLGLSVVHGIVQNHEGVITVYSRAGEGTVFHLYFPAQDGDIAELAAQADSLSRGHGERILVVDDERLLAQMTERILNRLGYVAESATSPEAALETISAAPNRYDLILTDLTMPNMTGVEFASSVLKLNPQIPIILMTGFFASMTAEQIHAIGIKEVLLKPITIHSLAATIDRVLEQIKTS